MIRLEICVKARRITCGWWAAKYSFTFVLKHKGTTTEKECLRVAHFAHSRRFCDLQVLLYLTSTAIISCACVLLGR